MIKLETFLKILEKEGWWSDEEISEFQQWYINKNAHFSRQYPLSCSEDTWLECFYSYVYDEDNFLED
jgi:hypothetical protein